MPGVACRLTGAEKEAPVRDWIVIAVLYLLVLVLFRIVGGVASAGEAMRRWGAHSSARRFKPGSSR
jgi:hypothetical protein